MGKRRYKEKNRKPVETIIDNSATKKIKLDLADEDAEYGGADEANLLVLPSEKRDTKIKKDEARITRILSKKQRKRLEKIVDQKKKKENRASLLEDLASVQLSSAELKQYKSLSSVQTKGLKKHFMEQKFGVVTKAKLAIETFGKEMKIQSLVGSRKKRLALVHAQRMKDEEGREVKKDLNTLGFDSSSSEEEDETEEEPEQELKVEDKVEENMKVEEEKIPEIIPTAKVLPEKVVVVKAVDRKPATYVHVERAPEIQAARLKLPILAEEQVIMETISENSIIIIAGETGSGKTTQIPQFLYEAGYAVDKMIGITEPRRVAAISMSKRVGLEMNLSSSNVSYLIRFEGNVAPETKIKFMTDGVLLKEIENDFLLSKYSVIILDEAHERSVYTDILVGLLSRIVILRNKKLNPFKLIIMSATLRVNDFTENKKLFKIAPPVINVESRQFPVTVHFSKTTPDDYVREVYLKTLKIHSKLPDGGILIFLTGQKEVNHIVKKLRRAFPYKGKRNENEAIPKINNKTEEKEEIEEDEDEELGKAIKSTKRGKSKNKKHKKIMHTNIELPQIDLDNYKLPGDDTEADYLEENEDGASDAEGSDLESDFDEELNTSALANSQPLWVLPLYSILSSEKQQRIFEPPPEGTRLCVVATNVAETSLTIPGIKYVVDCGRQKTKLYDKVTGVTAFVITYTSKASANQRAGRAGRIAAGHCYRLYSSAVYNDEFVDFAMPEIQKKPIDDLVLQMKCMGIDKVINFPFPSPPDLTQLQMAENRLKLMDAIEEKIVNNGNVSETMTRVTELGKTISAFPVAPRFGKMLALSHQSGLLPYTVCMVAALSVQEVLQEISLSEDSQGGNLKWKQKRKKWAGVGNSLLLGDPMILLRAVGASEYSNSIGKLTEFCEENGLRLKAIKEIRKLRVQLTNEINTNLKNLNLTVDPQMPPPTDMQAKLLRQLMFVGMVDQIARKIPDADVKVKGDKMKLKHAYHLPDMEQPVFQHSSSVLRKKIPEWVCYQEAYEIQQGDDTKMFIRGLTAIEPEWLIKFAPKMCNILKICEDPEPIYDVENDVIMCHVQATIGKAGWELPISEMEMPKDAQYYKYFAMFLLSGKMFNGLKCFRKHLLTTPQSILKTYTASVPRVETLLKLLMANEITRKSRLQYLWNKDKTFLLNEYKMWLPTSCHAELMEVWPPNV